MIRTDYDTAPAIDPNTPLAADWEEFARTVIAKGAAPGAVQAYQVAFYSGAVSLLVKLADPLDRGARYELFVRVQRLEKEIHEFIAEGFG